jgi:hypothetical protein
LGGNNASIFRIKKFKENLYVLQKVLITRDLFGGRGCGGVGGGGEESNVYFFFCHTAVLELSHFARSVLLLCMI